MSKTKCSEERMPKKVGRTGPLGSATQGQAQKGSPRSENDPPQGVGALPIRASAS